MKSERGNIVIYLLVGLALFAVLLTGLWWVKSQAPKTVAAPETTQTTTNTTPSVETTINQDDRGATTTEPTTPDTSTSTTTSPQTPSQDYPSQTSSTSTTTPSSSAAPTQPESQTPHSTSIVPVAASGPVEDSIMTALALGGVAYVTTAYIRSRGRSSTV